VQELLGREHAPFRKVLGMRNDGCGQRHWWTSVRILYVFLTFGTPRSSGRRAGITGENVGKQSDISHESPYLHMV
jgi:hypothetical protein